MAAAGSAAPYTAEPATRVSAPAATTAAAVLALIPPSTSRRQEGIPRDEGAHLADGVQLVLQKGLAAEAGLHRHDQHHVQPLQVGGARRRGR